MTSPYNVHIIENILPGIVVGVRSPYLEAQEITHFSLFLLVALSVSILIFSTEVQ